MRRFVSMIMISGASAITFAVAGVPFNGKNGEAAQNNYNPLEDTRCND